MPPTDKPRQRVSSFAFFFVFFLAHAVFLSTPSVQGRPRKVPLTAGIVNYRENSVNDVGTIMKVLMRSLKEKNKPLFTANNGFSRGLKPDIIMAGFLHNDQLVFAVRFKNRKLPELISPMELKLRAPSLLIQYYVSNLRYTYNN